MHKYALIFLGVLTAVLLAAPQLVIVGYVFLIIPGLVLTFIPTIFIYLLAMTLIRRTLPETAGVGATVTSAGLAFALGFLVMLPWRAIEMHRFQAASLPDIDTPQLIRLGGNVLIDVPSTPGRSNEGISCDHLCTALLATSEVRSVTRVIGDDAVTFRYGVSAPGTLVRPEHPQRIFESFNKLPQHRSAGGSFEAAKQLERNLQADWALRIAGGQVLTEDLAIPEEDVDWRVSFVDSHEPGRPRVQRFEIRDRDGNVRVRKSVVEHRVPAPFFRFGFKSGSGVDGFAGATFRIGGSRYATHRPYVEIDPTVELLRATTIPKPHPEPDAMERMERELTAMLDDAEANAARLTLAPLWLSTFQYDAGEEQIAAINRILLDDRIDDPHELLRKALRSSTELTGLRAGLTHRFLSAQEPRARSWYVACLVKLPDATFAMPTAEERVIWASATTIPEAAPFLERLADQGEPAVPELLGLLEEVLDRPWHQRWRVLKGLRRAFARLGPQATEATPRIVQLLSEQRSPLTNSAGDRMEWLVALNRMGVVAEELPFRRRVQTPAEREREAKRVRDHVRRFEAARFGNR